MRLAPEDRALLEVQCRYGLWAVILSALPRKSLRKWVLMQARLYGYVTDSQADRLMALFRLKGA